MPSKSDETHAENSVAQSRLSNEQRQASFDAFFPSKGESAMDFMNRRTAERVQDRADDARRRGFTYHPDDDDEHY